MFSPSKGSTNQGLVNKNVAYAVYYGAGSGYALQYVDGTSGGIQCDNATFGRDPAFGSVKSCYVVAVYASTCSEGASCAAQAVLKQYVYGVGKSFASITASDEFKCDKDKFGDPIPRIVKQCFAKSQEIGDGL